MFDTSQPNLNVCGSTESDVENRGTAPTNSPTAPMGYVRRRTTMKYMAIIYGNKALWESFAPDVIGEAIASVNAFNVRYARVRRTARCLRSR